MHTLIMHKLNYIFITIADINNGNWFRGAGHFERIMIKHAQSLGEWSIVGAYYVCDVFYSYFRVRYP